MCGIAGILSIKPTQDYPESRIQFMQKRLQHRGSDDQGIYISPDQQAAFAHTRLSILDITAAGHQPMSIANGRYWITFNGEIYNFQELRSNLEAKGETFYSQTDTEVILKLYQSKGKDCVQDLQGMFAFAIWDDWEKSCFIARDPLGIKPLYYYQSGSTLVFASELRAILASQLPPITLSSGGLYGYLTRGSVPEPYTMIDDVWCLEAGCWLYSQEGKSTQNQYWQIQFTSEAISQEQAQAKVRAALMDSIQHHFISDVPVGIFLSGGIDSSSVLALARQVQTGNLRTYSIAFEEEAWNEGDLAQNIATQFETEHTEYKITASLAKSLLPKFLASIDQPSIDGFNTFCVSQVAHQDGTKVVLSGLGGDELFGGYQSFQKVPQMVRLAKQFQSLTPLMGRLGQGLESLGKSPRARRLGDFLQKKPTTPSAYGSFRGIFSHQEACLIANHYLPDAPIFSRQQEQRSIPSFPSLEDEVSFLELTHYMRNQLLKDSDVMSMTWGLELRVPLVDRALLETISSIPSALRLAPGKQLLTQSIPELPDWVVNQPKRGFSFPFQKWIEGEWDDYFRMTNFPEQISLQLWYRRWSLAILQHWWESIST